MQPNNLNLRSLNELKEEAFYVPSYQRGYRWTRGEVLALLNDVQEFVLTQDQSPDSFYCLQPIVVAQHENAWELIDGQQRLTTLFLVLTYINSGYVEGRRKKLFSLEYATRTDSAAYLKNPTLEEKDRNIDFFHIHASYSAIVEWFSDKDHLLAKLESAFLNQVKVIWYEVSGGIAPVEVFTRLNMGKIPLTNAELVKALFLRARNFGEGEPKSLHQLKIAQEWDDIERRLQDDEFWYFLSNGHAAHNRIDLLLRLRAEEIHLEPNWRRDNPATYVFLAFNHQFSKAGVDVRAEWEKIKKLFLLLDEWFRDHYLYHLIGFRVFQHEGGQESNISYLRDLAKSGVSKSLFRKSLKAEVFKQVFRSSPATPGDLSRPEEQIRNTLSELRYESKRVRPVLLLFNLVSLIQTSHTRFPFNFFKTESWDIEHIRSVKSAPPERPDEQKQWLDNFLNYLGIETTAPVVGMTITPADDAMRAKVMQMRHAEKFDSAAFLALFNEIVEQYDPHSDPATDNSIGNLTLLDASTNRSYKNAVFPIKRREVIGLDKVGKFVPLCTKNAFLKYYSPKINAMLVWTKEDSAAHRDAMIDTFNRFFQTEETAK